MRVGIEIEDPDRALAAGSVVGVRLRRHCNDTRFAYPGY
jgi:hypothetical protein